MKKPLPPEIGQDLLAYVGCIAGAIPIEEYRDGLKEAGFAHVEIIDSGADLNAYAQIDGQVGCCGGEMVAEPVTIGAASCCTPAPAGSSECCTPLETVAIGEACCSPAEAADARAHRAARRARPPPQPERLRGEREGLRRQTHTR